MKICLIGATSFLARSIIEELLKKDDHILHLFSRKIPKIITQRHSQCIYSNYHFPAYPLPLNKKILPSEIIIYCAGAGIQPKHRDKSSHIFELNTFEPMRLINFLQKSRWQGQLITFGSYFEIGNNEQEKYFTEKELIYQRNILPNAYCESKFLLTQFIHQKLVKAEKLSFHLLHMILTNIYGKEENRERLIPYLVSSIKNKQDVSLTSGRQKRQYVHVKDVALLITQIVNQKLSGIFNITTQESISVKQVVEKTLCIGKKKTNIEVRADFGKAIKRDSNMQFLALDNSKARKKLGFKASISLEKGIETYFNN